MTPAESLHYAIGQVAYAMANIDGAVQKEERKKFHEIVTGELHQAHYAFDVSDIIFKILDKEKMDTETAYNWAIREIRLNSHYLDPQLKLTFLRVVEKIAKAFPPVTEEERGLLDRFRRDITPLEGDPVYYA